MPTVTASIGLPIELWEKCKEYKINRSAIARRAIAREIERIETGAASAKTTAPAATSRGGTQ